MTVHCGFLVYSLNLQNIGKEKVIEPFNVSSNKISSAKTLINTSYGGKFIGDELAKRGYVCLAVDMLNWSDQSGTVADGVQQSLVSNMMHLGISWLSLIAYEDMQAAEFLAQQKEVDSIRIATMGLSQLCRYALLPGFLFTGCRPMLD